MTLATIFRRFDHELYETTRENVSESIIAPIENGDISPHFRSGKAELSRMLPSPFIVRLQGFCERIAKMNVFLMPRIEDFIDRHLL